VPMIVTIGFAVVVSIGLVAGYFMSQVPTLEEMCRTQCAERNRSGRLVHVYPPEQTAGMRGKGPTNCECY
jgi:hypothetical protein